MKKEFKSKKTMKRTVTIDITEMYDRICDIAKDECRSVEEQCRYFIKKGMDAPIVTTTITAPINQWVSDSPFVYEPHKEYYVKGPYCGSSLTCDEKPVNMVHDNNSGVYTQC
jgi:hypothetical protein